MFLSLFVGSYDISIDVVLYVCIVNYPEGLVVNLGDVHEIVQMSLTVLIVPNLILLPIT